MKRILILFIAVFVSLVSIAQIRNIDTGYDKVVKDKLSAYFFTGTASDTIGVGDSTLTKTLFINTNDEVIIDVYVDIDSLASSGDVLLILKGKEFPDDAYTALDTVTWTMTGDTICKLTSSAGKYRYAQLSIEAPKDEIEAELQKAYFKFWK